MEMSKWMKLNNQVAGRDKQARFIQYFSRAIWDTLDKTDASPAAADSFRTVEYVLSTFRKLLRFGKCLDVFYTSFHTIHYPDVVIRITLTLSKLGQALFLFGDHMLWMARTGMFNSIDAKKWGTFANKYWLFSIIMNLCRDVYEIFRLFDLHKERIRLGISRSNAPRINSPRDLSRFALHAYALMLGHKDVAVDTIKNVCDFFIPFTALGYTRLTPQTIGILGAISSIAGLLALVDPTAKLTPA